MISKNLTVVNPSGLHLRPAGVLSQTAMKFKSDITIACGEKEDRCKERIKRNGSWYQVRNRDHSGLRWRG